MPPRNHPEYVIRQRLRALARALPKALSGDPRATHKARVASRRVREALPIVLASVPTKKTRKLRTRIERVTELLGPVREIDVSLALADELATPETAPAWEALRQQLQVERRRRQQRVVAKLDGFDVSRLEARAERLTTREPETAEQRLPGTAVLLLRLTKRVQKLEESVHAAGPLYAPEPLHAIRISVKKLRYAFELARDLKLLGPSRVLTTLRTTQQTLGRLHDLQVVIAGVDALRARAPSFGPQVEALNAVASQLEEECRQLHARFLARREKLVAAADEALADVAARAATMDDDAESAVVH